MLRLRQVCLIAHALEPVVGDLTAVLGLTVVHRDPAVAMFGLQNAILPVGDCFLEVVAPIEDGTAATRFLERRGPGGYMVILDTDDLAPWRSHLVEHGVRIAADLEVDGYNGLQLHPADTGGPLREINWSRGWETGAYHPAGAQWRPSLAASDCLELREVLVAATAPEALARRWAEILRHPVGPGLAIALDRGVVRLETARLGGDGLSGITVAAADPEAIRQAAVRRGCPVGPDHIEIGGIRIRLAATMPAPNAKPEGDR
jgi:hypothetical protein